MATPAGFPRGQVAAAIVLGVISLLMSGLMPFFLGALADEHRLSASGIGQLATLELLSTAGTTGLAGGVLKPVRLKSIAIVASLMLAAANAATIGASGPVLMAARALAGVPEGLLLWIVIGLIARGPMPERQAGFLFTAMASSQLVTAVVLALAVLPRFGADGCYFVVAAVSALGVLAALVLPSSYGPLPAGMESGMPPFKGWMALLAVFVFQAGIAGASVYIEPLAVQAGLSNGVAQTAISLALALEVLGGAVATAISGRAKFLDVLLFSSVVLVGGLGVYIFRSPAWLFICASASMGFCALLVMPFIVPMTIKADPSRRAAVQIGGAQLFGGAVGPVLASLVVSSRNSHGAVALSMVMVVASLGIIFALNRSNQRADRAAAQ